MRLRKVAGAYESLCQSKYFIENPKEYKNKWQSAFLKKQPIILEIGCGKGKFLISMAEANPNINFIGMEKSDSVLIRAIEKLKEKNLPNLKFVLWDASSLDEIFEQEIDTIYLTFSDPWPKKRHEKRRLTSHDFLQKYELIFKNTGCIIQKTDNRLLFEYSLKSFNENGWRIKEISLDLKESEIPNLKTEYEEKFIELGYPIYYVKVEKK